MTPLVLTMLILTTVILTVSGCNHANPNAFQIDSTGLRIETAMGNKNLGSLAYEYDGKVYYNRLPHTEDGERPEITVQDSYVDDTGIYEIREGSIFTYNLEGKPQTTKWPTYFTDHSIRMTGNNLVRVDPKNDAITSLPILKGDVTYLVRGETQYFFKYKDKLYTLERDESALTQVDLEPFDGMYVPTQDGVYYVKNEQLYLNGDALDIKTTKFNLAFGGIFYTTSEGLMFQKDDVVEVVAKGEFETFSIGEKYISLLDSEGVKLIKIVN